MLLIVTENIPDHNFKPQEPMTNETSPVKLKLATVARKVPEETTVLTLYCLLLVARTAVLFDIHFSRFVKVHRRIKRYYR